MIELSEKDADRIAGYLRKMLEQLEDVDAMACQMKADLPKEVTFFNMLNDFLITTNDEKKAEIAELLKILMVGSK